MAASMRKSLAFALRHLSVELIVFLVYLGYVFGNTFQTPAIYHRICRIYYTEAPGFRCDNLLDKDLELKVQQRSAEWSIYNGLAFLIPALLADTILGAYGDKFGWKTPIVLGVVGVTIAEFGYMLTLSSSVATPYWTTLIFGFVSGISGSISIIPVACNAFLAEITEDSDLLTVRAALFSAFQTLASVLGGFAAAGLSNVISVIVAMDVEIFLFFVALLFALWRIPQRKMMPSHTYNSEPPEAVPFTRQVLQFFVSIGELIKSGFHTYSRRRVGTRRGFLLITLFALILSYTTSIETTNSGVINSYVLRRTESDTLGWDSQDLGFWNGSGYLILAIGTFTGTWVLKRFGYRETTLMLIGTISSGIRVLLIGFAGNSLAMMYIANAVGVFAGLVQPAGVSFVVQLVAPSEIGKAFSLMGIGGDLSYLVATALYALVYRFSVAVEAGVVFFLIAGFHVLAVIAIVWMHFRSIREGVSRRRYTNQTTNAISRIGSNYEEKGDEEKKKKKSLGARFKKNKSNKISIAEHAEALENNNTMEHGIWQSEEDLRAHRVNRTLY